MSKNEPPILAALHRPDPEEAKLKAIRDLLKGVQEEGVVSDEEIRKLKKLENELLKRQKMYKKLLGNWNQKWKFTTRFYMLFPIPFLLCVLFFGNSLAAYCKFILLMSSWPVKSVAIVILFYFYRFDLNFPTWPEAPENEDDDWQDSMTSTEFQSRGKALLNSWEKLKTERNNHNASENLVSQYFGSAHLYT
ncbi:hypothetical protein CAEBREN_23365 [Caenorhabditis brenneri]|uniref:Uncharacterized protein n=1 Tax=Caenorhabditis brenneri TaxID=135651 RepID=G0MBW4_CAEBE|nr:hypothetical protein CAEBREN_23365 [Caenorhabditis brenneri]